MQNVTNIICALALIISGAGCSDNLPRPEEDSVPILDAAPDLDPRDDGQPADDLDAAVEPDMPRREDQPEDQPEDLPSAPIVYSGPKLCDPTLPPTRAPLRLYFYMAGGGNPSPTEIFVNENGMSYFMLDEACNYLIFSTLYERNMWSEVHQGRLSSRDLEGLEATLAGVDWDALNGTADVETGPDVMWLSPASRIFAVGEYRLHFSCVRCDAHGGAMRRFSEWFDALQARSDVYKPAALRLLAFHVAPEDEKYIHIPIAPLYLDLDLASNAQEPGSFFTCPGDGLLVDDLRAVRRLRELRDLYLAQYGLLHRDGIPIRAADGRAYKVVFRSATRFDGPDGPVLFSRDSEYIEECRRHRMLFPL
jgi:hypothetical protein